MTIRIAIAADHRGFEMKAYLKETFVGPGDEDIEWFDVGAYTSERSDYPVFAQSAVNTIRSGQAQYGILLCGTGVGMAIVANRYPKIYAALAWNEQVARESKEDDNANVLVLPSDFVSNEQALKMVEAWFGAAFKKGRYQHRIDMIDTIKV